jgi:hypothetical protein
LLEPEQGRPGDTITAHGRHLDRASVEDVSLVEPNRQMLVHILEQTETLIRFRIPATAAPGQYRLLIHPAGRYTSTLLQHVILIVK